MPSAAVRQLGFGSGARLATLTPVEISLLVSSCDVDGDGTIDSNEWCDRFSRALVRLQGGDLVCDQETRATDLQVSGSWLTPSCLEAGRWPDADEWSLSDHGIVTSTFRLRDDDDDEAACAALAALEATEVGVAEARAEPTEDGAATGEDR